MKSQLNRYNAWKADSKCEPIPDTDRVFMGKSKRAVVKHLAYEEGVEHMHNDILVRCKDGTIWFVHKI
jgi:hypothetical protein